MHPAETFWFDIDSVTGRRQYSRLAISGERGSGMIMDSQATPPNSRKNSPIEVHAITDNTEHRFTIADVTDDHQVYHR